MSRYPRGEDLGPFLCCKLGVTQKPLDPRRTHGHNVRPLFVTVKNCHSNYLCNFFYRTDFRSMRIIIAVFLHRSPVTGVTTPGLISKKTKKLRGRRRL